MVHRMRVVLFDAIQETHVAASLERALLARGHQVYATQRFGAGAEFVDPVALAPVLEPHLEQIEAFAPDLILVFRPSSAPPAVLERLRATGARLAVWLSDDPVLFGLSYGVSVDRYDLVLHCGNERVLQFYEDRFGRPTGVNFPFWTDHVAFPRVYGDHPPESTVMFLGNVVGPLRERRYAQLAGMRHSVRVFGRTGEDPAGIGGGYLDTEQEVLAAGARSRLALSIPQFFRDHHGQPSWFEGLGDLGHFDLPSRVIQYAAMGLPVISVVPGARACPAFPELISCTDIPEADRRITELLADGALSEISRQVQDRFERSFSAHSRVLALESLMQQEDWKRLDAAQRTVWFQQFDGRVAEGTAPDQGHDDDARPVRGASVRGAGAAAHPDRTASAPAGAAPSARPDVVVVHAGRPGRFEPVDVLLRELRHQDRLLRDIGPEDPLLHPAPTPEGDPGLDAPALLQTLAGEQWSTLILSGVELGSTDVHALHAGGIAVIRLVGRESVSRRQAQDADLVVRVGAAGPAEMSQLVPYGHAVHSPGLVESRFLEAVHACRDAAADTGRGGAGALLSTYAPEPVAQAVRSCVPGPHQEIPGSVVEALDVHELARTLCREVVYLQPARWGRRRQLHQLVLPYALCAAAVVVTARPASGPLLNRLDPWLIQGTTAREIAWKMSVMQAEDGHQEWARRQEVLDAGRQVAQWLELAHSHLRSRHPTTTGQRHSHG